MPTTHRFAGPILLLAVVALAPLAAETVTRGPYLQRESSTAVNVRWRTDVAAASRVRYGTAVGSYGTVVGSSTATTEHSVALTNLPPEASYYYTIGNDSGAIAGSGDATYRIVTSPRTGLRRATRVWAIGDFGTGGSGQLSVRNAYTTFTGSTRTAICLMLGDNAYNAGADSEYT